MTEPSTPASPVAPQHRPSEHRSSRLRTHRGLAASLAACLLPVLLLAAACRVVPRQDGNGPPVDGEEPTAPAPPASAHAAPQSEPRTVTARGDLAADEQSTIELFREAAPSVAYITTLTRAIDRFTLDVQEIPQGTGSGFVWDRNGHVVTNFHVVRGSSVARVKLADQTVWDAELVGVAPEKDLAVLRVAAPADVLRPLPLGSSADLQVGQKVFAIGNPFGLDHTLTTGVISALGREIRLEHHEAGDAVQVLFERDGAQRTVTVTLAASS